MGKNEQLEKLKSKQRVLKARIQKMEAAEKVKARKADVRRKILLGAYVLAEAKREGTLGALKERLYGYLEREVDKALFRDWTG